MTMILVKKGLYTLGWLSYALFGIQAASSGTKYHFYTDTIFYIYAFIGVSVSLVYSTNYLKPRQWVISYLSAIVICGVIIELKKNGYIQDSIYYLVTLGASSAAPTILGIWFSFVQQAKEEGGKVLWKAASKRLYKWISGEKYSEDYRPTDYENYEDYGNE